MQFLLDLYPSNFEEWQSLESIVDVLDCFHGSIGEQIYKGRSKSTLAENGVFFYDHFYYIPKNRQRYGMVEKIPLPDFDSLEWPLPSQSTSEAYRCRIFTEVQKCLKPNVASTQSRVNIFMPIEVFVDFFSSSTLRMTKTMIKIENMESNTMLQCVDKGWDTKEEMGVVCKIQHPSVCTKYIIPSQNFILTFYYKRWHYLQGRLIPLEQDTDNPEQDQIIELEIFYMDNIILSVKIRESCTLDQVRADLHHEADALPPIFFFKYQERKVKFYIFFLFILYLFQFTITTIFQFVSRSQRGLKKASNVKI